MAPEYAVLVDLNVILDVLQQHHPQYDSSAEVWSAVEQGKLTGYLAAHSMTTLFYLLNRHLGSVQTQQVISDLLSVFAVAPVNQEVILDALQMGWNDFEDAVQMAAAAAVQADFLITGNPTDFKSHRVRVMQPGEVRAILTRPQ